MSTNRSYLLPNEIWYVMFKYLNNIWAFENAHMHQRNEYLSKHVNKLQRTLKRHKPLYDYNHQHDCSWKRNAKNLNDINLDLQKWLKFFVIMSVCATFIILVLVYIDILSINSPCYMANYKDVCCDRTQL